MVGSSKKIHRKYKKWILLIFARKFLNGTGLEIRKLFKLNFSAEIFLVQKLIKVALEIFIFIAALIEVTENIESGIKFYENQIFSTDDDGLVRFKK